MGLTHLCLYELSHLCVHTWGRQVFRPITKKQVTGQEEKGEETHFKRFQDEQASHLKGKKKRLYISIRKATLSGACFPLGPVWPLMLEAVKNWLLWKLGKPVSLVPAAPVGLSFSSKSSPGLFIPDTH